MNDLQKIDSLVAEKVMGWQKEATLPEYFFWKDIEKGKLTYHIDDWKPSTNIKYAWEVVDKLRESLIFQFGDAWDENDKKVYSANFQYNDSYTWQNYEAYAETAPLAICLAALKAIGADIEKEVK